MTIPEPWSERQDRPSIVIVDDSKANLQIYSKLAGGIGQNVHIYTFDNPRAALEWLGHHGADLVISDYKMPEINGSEFIRRIRLLPSCADLPVVIVTAHADYDFRVAALEAGATDFLRNPVDQMEFRTRSRNLLRLGRHQRLMRAQAVALEHELLESERSRAQILRESRAWLAQIIDTVPAMISATDAEGTCIFMNAYQGIPRDPDSSSADGSALSELDRQVLESGQALAPIEENLADGAGSIRNLLTVKSPLRGTDGKTVAVLTTSVDITERKQAEARLAYQAQHDHLTSLPNRAHLYKRICQEIDNAAAGRVFALHFIDLDRFKYVNDGLGHHFGDRLLQEVGQRLKAAVRDGDVVARLGGDEFAILQAVEKPADAAQFAERINQLLLRPFMIDSREVTTSASIGVTLCPLDGESPEQLLQNADLAMYRVKAGRGNGFGFFEDGMLSEAREFARLREALRHALEAEEFVLHYQPQVSLNGGGLIGAEALIRWQSSEEGLLYPAKFLPVADEAGLMRCIDRWVVHEACRQAKVWLEKFAKPIRIWVNLSPATFMANAAAPLIKSALESTGAPPSLLGIELTEEVMPQNSNAAAEELDRLHGLGVGISIDDFGTGYSCLSKLANLKVDKLKIDRDFVAGLDNSSDTAIIRAVVSLGQALNLEILAEGVETAHQLEQLLLAGCESVQGYYTGRPVDAQQFEAFLQPIHPTTHLIRSAARRLPASAGGSLGRAKGRAAAVAIQS